MCPSQCTSSTTTRRVTQDEEEDTRRSKYKRKKKTQEEEADATGRNGHQNNSSRVIQKYGNKKCEYKEEKS